jgi:hypothetical protein
MTNMNLNPGGAIGGLAGAGVGAMFLAWKGDTEGRVGKLIIGCVVAGAVAGNYLWGLVFPSRDARPRDGEGPPSEGGNA